jgi:hypothetical protein
VNERDRSDLGDISELAASIAAVGLLHPVVITADNELITGGTPGSPRWWRPGDPGGQQKSRSFRGRA